MISIPIVHCISGNILPKQQPNVTDLKIIEKKEEAGIHNNDGIEIDKEKKKE